MRRILVFMALAAVVGALPARADTRKADYVAGPLGDIDGPCANGPIDPLGVVTGVTNPTPVNAGSVCFGQLSGFSRASVTIADVAGWKVAFWAGFAKANGTSLGGRWYCRSGSGIIIPTGAARLVVYIAGAASGLDYCPDDVGIGTNGTVTAVLS